MADQFDRAQDMDAYFREQAMAVWRQKTELGSLTSTHCEDCGGLIPPRRRQAAPGCTRCRDCQQLWENDRK